MANVKQLFSEPNNTSRSARTRREKGQASPHSEEVRLSNITPIAMIESVVSNIGPVATLPITNITPGISAFSAAEALPFNDGSNTVRIYASIDTLDANLTATVGFASANVTTDQQAIHANNYTASNIV